MYFIGFTGHTNIEKANDIELQENGLIYDKKALDIVYEELKNAIYKIKEEKNLKDIGIVSGMARGVDEVAALIAMDNNLPLILSIPNSVSWHISRPFSRGVKAQAVKYKEILKYVKNRINEGCKYSKINEIKKEYIGKVYKYANEARNQNIIDASNIVVSYLKYPSSGTLDGIDKAKKKNKYYNNITDISIKGKNK
jgi:vacuolar-type H+-ATPase subunit F/Vma7